MSIRSLVYASALVVAGLGLSGCVDVGGPYGPYGGYYDTGPVFLGGGYYDGGRYFRPRYRHYDHGRYSHRSHYVPRRNGSYYMDRRGPSHRHGRVIYPNRTP